MSADQLLDLWRGAMEEIAMVAAPFLIAALVVGVAVALIQTATQIQEASLSFVPKLLAAILVLALFGHTLLDRLGRYTKTAFDAAAQTHEAQP